MFVKPTAESNKTHFIFEDFVEIINLERVIESVVILAQDFESREKFLSNMWKFLELDYENEFYLKTVYFVRLYNTIVDRQL